MRLITLWRYFFGKSRKLKPCPFCRHPPEMINRAFSFIFYCDNKNCKIQPESKGSSSIEDAIDDWNSRSNITERIKWPRK